MGKKNIYHLWIFLAHKDYHRHCNFAASLSSRSSEKGKYRSSTGMNWIYKGIGVSNIIIPISLYSCPFKILWSYQYSLKFKNVQWRVIIFIIISYLQPPDIVLKIKNAKQALKWTVLHLSQNSSSSFAAHTFWNYMFLALLENSH